MKSLRPVLISLLSFGLAACHATSGSTNFEGRKISKISIRKSGPGLIPDHQILERISSKQGTLYSSTRLDSDIRSLYESGLVDDVIFTAKPHGEGVQIIAEVTTRRPLGPGGGFIGNSAFSDEKLAKVTELKAGQAATSSRLSTAISKLEQFYRLNGYPNIRITSRLKSGEPKKIENVFFIITEGPVRNP